MALHAPAPQLRPARAARTALFGVLAAAYVTIGWAQSVLPRAHVRVAVAVHVGVYTCVYARAARTTLSQALAAG